VLHERVKIYRAWKDEELALTKKREAKVKLELAHKTDKVSAVTHEITEVSAILGNVSISYVLSHLSYVASSLVNHKLCRAFMV